MRRFSTDLHINILTISFEQGGVCFMPYRCLMEKPLLTYDLTLHSFEHLLAFFVILLPLYHQEPKSGKGVEREGV